MDNGERTTGGGFQLEDALEIFERRKYWIAGGLLLGLSLGFALYLVLPPVYTASTSMLVEPQEVPKSFVQSTVTTGIERRLHTLRERVTSYANLNVLIDRVSKERLDPPGDLSRESLMNDIRKNLTVELGGNIARKAAVFEISFTSSDPEVAADVAREVANLFINENLKDRARQAEATAEFLDNELDRVREEVEAQEQRVAAYREEHMGTLPTQLEPTLAALDRTNSQLTKNLEAQQQIADRIELIRQQIRDAPSDGAVMVGGQPTPGSTAAALQSARAALLQAERVYTDEHPNVVRLRAEVAQLEEEVRLQAEAVEKGEAPIDPGVRAMQARIDAAELELAARKREEERLRGSLSQMEARVDEIPRFKQDLTELTRDYENSRATYRKLLAKKQDAALARNLELAQKGERVKVLRPARPPRKPSSPNLFLLLGAGAGFGLALMAGLIGLQEFRNPAFRSVARLTRTLGLPVLASVPRIDNDRIYDGKPDDAVDSRLVVHTAPDSAPAEQYRGFAPVLLEHPEVRVVLVTSAARGDGKSLTCMNLALTAARDLNRRVLVIDADLRRPTAHRLLRVKPRTGLSDVLEHSATLEDTALNSKVPNLTLLPAGHVPANPLALLTDPAFVELVEEAKREYDTVFIDSPPLLPVVDTRVLRTMADMVIFVVRADTTPREAVVRSMQDLKGVAGVVFNEVSPGSFRRYYYYDAYARYAYGEDEDRDEHA